jgi:hypothetical protein
VAAGRRRSRHCVPAAAAASIRPNERRWCAVSSSCHATTEAVR